LNKGKQLLGTWGGDTDLDRDVERYGQIISDNEANFEAVFFEKFGLRDINQALEELVVGSVGRPVIDMSIKSMV
jgi:S-(hydroxymethyl)glutathione dehydrogenase/alcohol dehydrogenase